jgi:hypothetical protein
MKRNPGATGKNVPAQLVLPGAWLTNPGRGVSTKAHSGTGNSGRSSVGGYQPSHSPEIVPSCLYQRSAMGGREGHNGFAAAFIKTLAERKVLLTRWNARLIGEGTPRREWRGEKGHRRGRGEPGNADRGTHGVLGSHRTRLPSFHRSYQQGDPGKTAPMGPTTSRPNFHTRPGI